MKLKVHELLISSSRDPRRIRLLKKLVGFNYLSIGYTIA